MTIPDEIRTRIEQEIEKARKLKEKPPNEQCTCDWVIRPLLQSAGYEIHEIVAQGAMPGGGIPDYTILPHSEWTWYLEAKTWDKNLEAVDAVQGMNYAHAQGRRWVVLSNGRQWLLFDDYLTQVPAQERLVAQVKLEDDDFVDFLAALSKPSVTGGKLEQYVISFRIRSVLDKQLADKNSEVVKAITNALKKLGIAGVQTSDVVEYFRPERPEPEKLTLVEPCPTRGVYNLSELHGMQDRLSYTVPAEVTFPDGSVTGAPYWADVAHQIVRWLADRGKLPQLPFRGLPGGNRWFVNTEPMHASGKEMERFQKITVGGNAIYLDTNRSGVNFAKCLHALCEAVGVPASGFLIKFSKPPQTD